VATLYVVSTPIGNLEDLSPRAERVLRSVDRILAEDTRHTRILADRAQASAPLVSLHEHNERKRTGAVLAWLEAGEELALVSDAGTPLVSDPGARLVEAVAAAGHTVTPIPGPSAALAALTVSGLPTDRFSFLGFPERKGRARRALLERVAGADETVILYESPHRTQKLLQELADLCEEDRGVAVARELTKVHEEIRRGTLADLAAYYEEHPPRGEVTVVVGPRTETPDDGRAEARARTLARELLSEGLKPSAVAREIAGRLDRSRNDAYRIALDAQNDSDEA
jgi:16S rRNA (cytidine1402-2'-O)-methyltransferase